MIEFIILYFLARKIGIIARSKGEKPLSWKIYFIVAYILGEITGGLIVLYFFGRDFLLISFFGAGLGLIGYYIIKQKLESLSDIED